MTKHIIVGSLSLLFREHLLPVRESDQCRKAINVGFLCVILLRNQCWFILLLNVSLFNHFTWILILILWLPRHFFSYLSPQLIISLNAKKKATAAGVSLENDENKDNTEFILDTTGDLALQADFFPFENDRNRQFFDSDSNGNGFLSKSDGSICSYTVVNMVLE